MPTYGVGVSVGVAVGVSVGVLVEVAVPVDVDVGVKVEVGVPVVVGVGVIVNVAVGACPLWRVMRGSIQSAKSSRDEPFVRTDIMNLTFSPFNELRSILIG